MAYADIGLNEEGSINFGAPVISRFDIQGIPYYFAIDGDGTIVSQGNLSTVTGAIGK